MHILNQPALLAHTMIMRLDSINSLIYRIRTKIVSCEELGVNQHHHIIIESCQTDRETPFHQLAMNLVDGKMSLSAIHNVDDCTTLWSKTHASHMKIALQLLVNLSQHVIQILFVYCRYCHTLLCSIATKVHFFSLSIKNSSYFFQLRLRIQRHFCQHRIVRMNGSFCLIQKFLLAARIQLRSWLAE